MTVVIDATNYVIINAAGTAADWTSTNVSNSDGTLGPREGSTYQQAQASEEVWSSTDAITSADFSARTIFGWQLSGAPATEANATGAGFAMTLGDGTDNIAYAVGGSDNYGFFFQGWSMFRLNGASRPTTFRVIAGVEANLGITTITNIGYGGHFPGKAVGNSSNIKWDQLAYVVNTNPALLVEGGTTGARGTWQEFVTEDESTSNAWGIIRQLIPGSKAYELNFGIHIGENGTTDSFFDDSDFQLYINGDLTSSGGAISAGSMDIDFIGNATATTNLINFDNFFVQSLGAVSNWDASNVDIDELIWSNGQFVDMGTFLFQAQDAGQKTLSGLIWTNCGQVTFVGIDVSNCAFVGTTNALGAVFWNGSSVTDNQDNLTFTSDGTGHAIEINLNTAALTTFNTDGYTVNGYETASDGSTGNTVFLVDNALDGDVDINVVNGTGTFSYERAAGYTGTVQIIASVSLTLTNIQTDSEVRLINLDDTTNFNKELDGIEQVLGGVTSATIADGGSGYTNGAQVLTVVGGTGSAATINVNVVAGVVDSITSIATPGSYSVNPSTPSTTSGGGGTGCTLRLNISGEFEFTYSASGLGGTRIAIIVFHLDFREVRIEQPLATESQSIPIQQTTDRVYNNP